MHACHESRNLGLYRKFFVYSEGSAYHWVNFDFDVIQIRPGSLRLLPDTEADLVQHVRVEFERGTEMDDFDDGWGDFASRLLLCSYPEVSRVDYLIDTDFDSMLWIVEPDGSWGFGSDRIDWRLINVRTGEYLDSDIWWKYTEWQDTISHLRNPDWGETIIGKEYTSTVCPSDFIRNWTFPPEGSIVWNKQGLVDDSHCSRP